MRKLIAIHKLDTKKLELGKFVKELIVEELSKEISRTALKEGLITVDQRRLIEIDPVEKDETVITAEAVFISKEELVILHNVMRRMKAHLPADRLDLYYQAQFILEGKS